MTDITVSGLRNDVSQILGYGTLCVFRYFNSPTIAGSTYDDLISAVTTSGTDTYVSGLQQPIRNKKGSFDGVLLSQGKIAFNDSVLYVNGIVQTSGLFKVHVGSPITATNWFTMNDGGVVSWPLNNSQVFKKIYITRLEAGSLPQEYPAT